jgi:hypothetical protein
MLTSGIQLRQAVVSHFDDMYLLDWLTLSLATQSYALAGKKTLRPGLKADPAANQTAEIV